MKLTKIHKDVPNPTATYTCEFCEAEYDAEYGETDYFYNTVVPNMRCAKCGKNSKDK